MSHHSPRARRLARTPQAALTALAAFTVALTLLLAGPVPALAKGRLLVIQSPVNKQFLTFGAESGLWLGSGTISTLDAATGLPGEPIGDFTDLAIPIGPFTVGISHVVTEHVMFEARLGAGAALFLDDRLVSTRLTDKGEPFPSWTFGFELGGRYFTDSGFCAGLSTRISALGLPEARSTFLAVGPRVGYLSFDERYTGYWIAEVGWMYPIINGFIPDFQGASEAPITSTWQMFGVYLGVGM